MEKQNKLYSQMFLIVICLVILGIFQLGRYFQKPEPYTKKVAAQNYENFVQKLERDALLELKKLNITTEILKQAFKIYKNEFYESTEIKGFSPISFSTQQFVIEILKEFNLDPQDIQIVYFNHPAPAASCRGVIFINETLFLRHSFKSQRFIIGHEIQHILSNDFFTDFVINKLTQASKNPEIEQIMSNYSKIIEQIADNKTALINAEWAECYLAFIQESIEQDGNKAKTIHPQHIERLKIAENIIQNQNKFLII